MRTKKKPRSWLNIFNLPWVDLSELEFQGLVERAIVPPFTGRVEYQGSTWPAICSQNIPLNPGELVQIVGRDNLTLLVTPVVQSNLKKNLNVPASKQFNRTSSPEYSDQTSEKKISRLHNP